MLNRFCFGTILLAGLAVTFTGCGSNTNVGTIEITPATQSLAAGQTAQFSATGTVSHGSRHPASTEDVTNQVTWTCNAPAVATISSSGLATAVSAGTTTITASMPGALAATATITVTGTTAKPADGLVSLSVTPSSQTALAVNEVARFTAIGTTASGATVNLTNQTATVGAGTIKAAVWSSSIPAVATINSATGVATAISSGTTAITAVATNPDGTVVTGTATLTVTLSAPGAGEPLVSLAIGPAAQSLTAANQTAQLIAIGTTGTGSTVNLTNVSATVGSATIKAAVWTSSNPSVATVDPATGIATSLSSGVTVITAIAANPDGTVVTGTSTLTVTITATSEPLVSLAIVPASQTASVVGQTAQFIAIGTTSTGATVNLTNQSATINGATIAPAAWGTSSQAVATIDPAKGLATAVSSGIVAITAVANNPDGTAVTGTATFTVTTKPEPLVSLAIVPESQTASVVGQAVQYLAIGTTASGATVNLTGESASVNGAPINPAVWGSSSKAIATIDPATGLATAVSAGTVAITAQATNPDGTVVTGTATFTVNTNPEPLVSLTVIPSLPGPQLTQPGQTIQYIAIGTTASGATVNLTNRPATIGTATIQPVVWSSSTLSVGTIGTAGIPGASPGLAVAGITGVTGIVAIAYNPDGTAVTGASALTVMSGIPEPIVSLAIVPTAQTGFAVNQTAQFIAIGTTSTGATVNLTSQQAVVGSATIEPAVWSSSNPQIATATVGGVISALSAGSTAIIAAVKNPDGTVVTGTAVYTVTLPSTPEALVSMAINPPAQTLAGGQTANLTAIATSGSGSTLNLTNQTATLGTATIQPAVWSSSDPGVATVNQGTGVVTAISSGVTAIVATASNPDGTVVAGTSVITVTSAGGFSGSIASINIIPGSQAVASPPATGQFLAIGTTTTGATVDLTNQVAWSSSSAQIATISTVGATAGLATATGQGSAAITALYTPPGNGNVVTGTATFTVVGGTTEQYTALTIIPGTQTLSSSGQHEQFIALGAIGSTGNQLDVTDSQQITWSSSAPTIASISSTGLAIGLSVGSTTITAELKNPDGTVVSTTANVTVVATAAPEPLLSLSIIPNAITVGDLQDTGNFIAIGTFNTAPYTQDVTNSPNTTWISSFPDDFPVSTNSGGTLSASGGIVTAYASGGTVIIAEYKDPTTQSIQTATATFNCPLKIPDPTAHPPTPGSCYAGQTGPLKATLTVYGEGLNTTNWLVTGPSATGTPDVIHCGPGWTGDGNPGGSVCTGIYPIGSTVLLTAPAQTGVAFGGWTYNCTPSDVNGNPLPGPVFWTATGPNYCTISLGGSNATVGAIFNNQ